MIKKGKIVIKITLALFFSALVCFTVIAGSAMAQTEPPASPGSNAAERALNILDATAQEAKIISSAQAAPTAYGIIGDVINIILSFLGVVFLLLIIYGGITWMRGGTVVGGGATKVDINKAKQIITQATIGLVIVLFAYLVTNFVIFKIIEVAVD
ncbi:hypothetical protein KJ840_02010 [Patescibacteria group bacterium]|nr:hypothetical protein [Patescibacteria group bacterium]